MQIRTIFLVAALALGGCADSSIESLGPDAFRIGTRAAPACGPDGAQRMALRSAAIEVIRRGGDRFVVAESVAGTEQVIGQSMKITTQDMAVRMVGPDQPGDSLSARTLLGPDWQTDVAEGVPQSCT